MAVTESNNNNEAKAIKTEDSNHWGKWDNPNFANPFPVLKPFEEPTNNNNNAVGGESNTYADLIKTESSIECSFCNEIIVDRYILQVGSRCWHQHCLRCSVCHVGLDTHHTCFIRDDQLYCKADYAKMFGVKCFKCTRLITSADWVRKARDQVYHLACFACVSCNRQLSTGEEFGIHENKVLCKAHYVENVDGGCTSSDESAESEAHSKKKTKRMRTTFTDEQVQILQANFQIDSNPDGQDLERIAQITGLSKRVTQVWFQNCRARQKKYINSSKNRTQRKPACLSGMATAAAPLPAPAGSPAAATQTPHVDLHVMYSTFRAQPNTTSSDGDEGSQDSATANFASMASEV